MNKFAQPDATNQYLAAHVALLRRSYQRLTGQPLVAPELSDLAAAEQLYQAPFALVSHDTQADPVFNYANRTAMELFEMSWLEFTQLPSKNSAESMNQAERACLLADVKRQGFAQNYQGVRISKSGRRFVIKNVTVWNLLDELGQYQGQAACYDHWEYL